MKPKARGRQVCTIDGVQRALYDHATFYGVQPTVVLERFESGVRGKALVARRYKKIRSDARLVTYNGKTMTVLELCRITNANYSSVSWRLQRGMAPEAAIQRRADVVYNGKLMSRREAARASGVNYGTLSHRIQKGETGPGLFRIQKPGRPEGSWMKPGQSNTKTLEYRGKIYTYADFGRLLGRKKQTVHNWIKRGLTPGQMVARSKVVGQPRFK